MDSSNKGVQKLFYTDINLSCLHVFEKMQKASCGFRRTCSIVLSGMLTLAKRHAHSNCVFSNSSDMGCHVGVVSV